MGRLQKIISYLLVSICVISLTFPVYAATRISISRVRLNITLQDNGGRIRPEAEPIGTQSRYDVVGIWGESEFNEDFFDAAISDIYDSPVFIIQVVAEDGYYFSGVKTSFSGFDVECKKIVYKDEKESIYLLCTFGNMADWGNSVGNQSWNSTGIAAWQPVAGAATYELRLYRENEAVGTVCVTKGNRYDFRPLMLTEGNYHYRINSCTAEGVTGAVITSEGCYVNNDAATGFRNQSQQTDAGWQQQGSRWWYRNSDGMYEQDNWKLIDGKWYYFDGEGYMVADQWVHWNGQDYYLKSNGEL